MVQVPLFWCRCYGKWRRCRCFGAGVTANGAGLGVSGAGVIVNGAGAFLGGGPAPLESVEWDFVAQVWAVKTHLHQKRRHLLQMCKDLRQNNTLVRATPQSVLKCARRGCRNLHPFRIRPVQMPKHKGGWREGFFTWFRMAVSPFCDRGICRRIFSVSRFCFLWEDRPGEPPWRTALEDRPGEPPRRTAPEDRPRGPPQRTAPRSPRKNVRGGGFSAASRSGRP